MIKLAEEMKQDFVNQATAQVGIGSAVSYPFGVIIVILAVNLLNVIFRFDIEEEKKKYSQLSKNKARQYRSDIVLDEWIDYIKSIAG